MRTGLVYRTERQPGGRVQPANRPFSAYTVPVTIQDPGPDGVVGNADDGSAYTGYNLSAAALALPIVNTYGNVDGARATTTPSSSPATKRMSHAGPRCSSFSKTWTAHAAPELRQSATFFGTQLPPERPAGLAAGSDQHRARRARSSTPTGR